MEAQPEVGPNFGSRSERFFALITNEAIRRGNFLSVSELVSAIRAYLDAHNAESKHFAWTATLIGFFKRLRDYVNHLFDRTLVQADDAAAKSALSAHHCEPFSETIILKNQSMSPQPSKPIHPGVSIGHVHLKVANLERALRFYCDVLGFEVTMRYGSEAAFISAGGYHHHIGLNTWESLGGSPPAPGTTGLYHLAILYPTRAELADALLRLRQAGIPLDGASDHGVSEALYLRDPDGNGIELYWDRPHDQWPHTPDGKLAMFTRPLDLERLAAAANIEP